MNARTIPLVAALMTLSSAAHAAGRDEWARSQETRLGLEVDVLSTSISRDFDGVSAEVSTLGIGFDVVGQLEIKDRLYADVEIPFAYGNVATTFSAPAFDGAYREESKGGFLFGNPTLGVHRTYKLGKDLVAFVGGTFSIPTIDDPSREAFEAVLATLRARAFFDVHRMIPEHLPLRARAGGEVRFSKAMRYRGDLGAMLAIPTDSGDAELYIEQGNEIEGRFEEGVGLGLRFQEVLTLTESDKVQTALEPFVSYERPDRGWSGFYARLGLLVALDGELGFGFDTEKVATLRLAAGLRF